MNRTHLSSEINGTP